MHEINAGKELIISGEFNQEIGGDEPQQFYREMGVQDVLSGHERIPCNERDFIFKRGSRRIDSISVSEGLMTSVERCEVIDWDETFSTDHRVNVIELNLEQLFNENMHEIDAVTRSQLDLSRSIHKEMFKLKIDEQINCMML